MRTLLAHSLFALIAFALPTAAQERPNLMIVFDGSGSMWGQVDGRAKIELARQALSSVLSEASPDLNIGMLAYGHRVRGQCSDIELMVQPGPGSQTVPQIIDAANRMNPRGMTPLTDAVLMAAQRLSFGEQAATVVLLTDGIETCEGDPCALGRILAEQGIDFTAHVVGFDLSDSEQQQISCLADETGGLFIAASDANELRTALARTIAFEPPLAPLLEPEPALRRVEISLRDTVDGPHLTRRQVQMLVEPLDEDGVEVVDFTTHYEGTPFTASGQFRPGDYHAYITRATDGRNSVRLRVPFSVPADPGTHSVDLVIAARFRLMALAHADLPMPPGSGNLRFAAPRQAQECLRVPLPQSGTDTRPPDFRGSPDCLQRSVAPDQSQ